jgi:hypothetical protein
MTAARRGAKVALLVAWAVLVGALSLVTARLAPGDDPLHDCAVVVRSVHIDGVCLEPR